MTTILFLKYGYIPDECDAFAPIFNFFQEVQYNLAALSSGSAHKCICYAHRHLCMSLLSVESQVEEPSKAMDAPSSQPLEVKMVSHLRWGQCWSVVPCCFLPLIQTAAISLNLSWRIRSVLILCVCVLRLWQQSAALLGQFKEFMVKYNKVYSSQEGEWLNTPSIPHVHHIPFP